MTSKQIVTVIVITFFVGMIWLIADIIFNTKASVPISDKLQVLLEPVNPTFNARVLEKIDQETLDRGSITVTDAEIEPLPVPDAPVVPTVPDLTLTPGEESSSEGELSQ